MSTAAILLAAGRGSRLGGTTPKALVSLGNQALLCKTLAHYLEATAIDQVVLVLGYGAEQIRGRLPIHERLIVVANPNWAEGMSTSIRLGMEELGPDVSTVVLGLGDMPWITPEILDEVARSCESTDRIVAPYFRGERGHPVAFPSAFFAALRSIEGDRGGASLLKANDVVALDVEEPGVLRDIDTARDIPAQLPRVILRGGGDLASGVAHRLYVSGFPVVILELAQPRMLRSTVSFAQAVYSEEIRVEGVLARRYNRPPSDWRSALPVVIDPEGEWIERLRPDVIVDARMLKMPDGIRKELAPFVVALGPGICAGRDCHAIVETERGHALGKVILNGPAAPDTGIPGVLGGEGERRVLRSPTAGLFRAERSVGDMVAAGDRIASVGDRPVVTLIGGQIRGLLHSGLEVRLREKLGDVDPRNAVELHGISDKARAVGGGVMEAILRWHCGSWEEKVSER